MKTHTDFSEINEYPQEASKWGVLYTLDFNDGFNEITLELMRVNARTAKIDNVEEKEKRNYLEFGQENTSLLRNTLC